MADNPIDNILEQSPEERTLELTDDQKKIVDEMWANSKNPPRLADLTVAVWGPKTDARTWKGKLIREYLATKSLKAAKGAFEKREKVILTPEQKEFVANNCHKMSVLDLAKALFNNPRLSPLHFESKAVMDYIKELHPAVIYEEPREELVEDYIPPKSLPQAIYRVNKYIYTPLEEEKLTIKQKKALRALIGYLHTTRFMQQIVKCRNLEDRILFESEFIRCTYDKDDLTEEEVDQFIIYSTEVIIGKNILDRIGNLEAEQDVALEEQGRLNIALVDAVKALRDEYNKCVKRQNDLLYDLKGKRRERLQAQMNDTASILNLVNLWKEEESRKQLIELADKEREVLKVEMERLTSLDDVRARILGITKDEVLYK